MTDYKNYIGYKDADAQTIQTDMRDSRGVWKTESLFEETIQQSVRDNGYEPIYSLREYENNGKPSAYYIYMNSIDETDAAIRLVGSLTHWRKLCGLKWFINGRKEVGFEGLAQWRRDKADRDATLAKQVLIEQTIAGNVTAARALDKMAKEDASKADQITSKRPKAGKQEEDGLEFLDDYRNS